MNSLWLVITSLAAFLVAYRYYGAFLAAKVAVLNDQNVTPAHRLRDDVDYQPTRRLVLFGVHFAAIAGPRGRSVHDRRDSGALGRFSGQAVR